MENLEEIDTFLETYNLPKLNHDKIEKLNRLITSKEDESVIKNLPTNKCPGPDGFSGKYYQIFKEELIPIPSQTLPKNRRGRNSSKISFYLMRPALP